MRTAVLLALCISAIQAVPWVAEPRTDVWWVQRHLSFQQYTSSNAGNISVLFYGDSITEGWGGAGNAVYSTYYGPLGAANYGIGGDRTEHLLYRIADGEVTPELRPKLVVLKIGTNNGGDSEADVIQGIRAVVDLLLERLPNSKVLLLGILPRSDYDAYQRIANINIHISKFADNQKVFFLNMFDQFSSSWGNVDASLFSGDRLHLETPGYQKWAETMEATFNRVYNM